MKYQVNQLVPNSKYPMNSLSIKIPFAYAEKIIKMNWSDILFGIKIGCFNRDAAIEHAKSVVSDESEQELIDLLCLSPTEVSYSDLLLNLIAQLADKLSTENKEQTKEKFLYLLLRWLYDNKDEFDYPLLAIEVLWDDFDFPESIKHLIGYLPAKDTDKVGVDVIYDNWREYLTKSKYRRN